MSGAPEVMFQPYSQTLNLAGKIYLGQRLITKFVNYNCKSFLTLETGVAMGKKAMN